MGDADHRRLGLRAAGPAVAGQALVAVDVDQVAANAVGNGGRLFGIVAFAAHILVFVIGQRRCRLRFGQCAAGAATVRPRGIQRVAGVGGQRRHGAQQGQERECDPFHGCVLTPG
ncbi:hypothetical protein D9M70_598040 [compost metagenome]